MSQIELHFLAGFGFLLVTMGCMFFMSFEKNVFDYRHGPLKFNGFEWPGLPYKKIKHYWHRTLCNNSNEILRQRCLSYLEAKQKHEGFWFLYVTSMYERQVLTKNRPSFIGFYWVRYLYALCNRPIGIHMYTFCLICRHGGLFRHRHLRRLLWRYIAKRHGRSVLRN